MLLFPAGEVDVVFLIKDRRDLISRSALDIEK